MPKTKQFNLLMVRDDGSRVLRLSIPTWVVGAVVGGFSVTLLGLAFIYPDYVTLRHQRGTFTALSARLHTQQALLDAAQARHRARRVQQGLNERGLAHAAVPDDADVTELAGLDRHCGLLPSDGVGPMLPPDDEEVKPPRARAGRRPPPPRRRRRGRRGRPAGARRT